MKVKETGECPWIRELLSQALDGEADAPADPELMETHLRDCGPCRHWREQAVFLHRTVASSRLTPPAGLTAAVAMTLRTARRRTATRVLAVRAALVTLAMVGLALAIPALLWGRDDGLELHVSHELGSTEIALYAGLLAAALWPRRSRGILAVLGAASILLVATAASDIAAHYTTVSHEADHLIAVAGALLVWALTRLVPESAPPVRLVASALDHEEMPGPATGRPVGTTPVARRKAG